MKVGDLKSLSALLHRLEDDATHTVIRRSLVDGKTNPVPESSKLMSK